MSRRDGRNPFDMSVGLACSCSWGCTWHGRQGLDGKLLQTTEHTDMCCSHLSSQKPLDPSISLQEKITFELRSPSSFLSASLHSAQGSSGMLPPFWHLPFKGSSLLCQLEFGFELVNLPTAASQGRLSLSWHLHIRIRILPLLIDMAYD